MISTCYQHEITMISSFVITMSTTSTIIVILSINDLPTYIYIAIVSTISLSLPSQRSSYRYIFMSPSSKDN